MRIMFASCYACIAHLCVSSHARAHIICVKTHTVSVKNLLLLGKSLLHSQDKVGGLLLSLVLSCCYPIDMKEGIARGSHALILPKWLMSINFCI